MNLKNQNICFIAYLLLVCFSAPSCKKFVDIDAPKGKLDPESTFNSDGSATAAVLDVYARYESDMLYINTAAGAASDEMKTDDFFLTPILNNEVPLEGFVNDTYLWATPFYQIRRCNLAIDRIGKSVALTSSVKDQLLGEAYFLRALQFFNLVNIYGGVPLTLSPAEAENSMLSRSNVEDIWKQIFLDLRQAKTLLKPAYPSGERVRANQYAAIALLARAYLYHKDWSKAEEEATAVIGSGMYSLVSPDFAFKKTSNETILQLYTQTGRTSLAPGYIPFNMNSTPMVYLRDELVQAFEKNGMQDDARKTNWTGKNNNGITFINKYKQSTGTGNEYIIVLRLGELYLIRAEARAWQDKLNGTNSAEADLNEIRSRALLDAKLNLGKADLLKAIEQERRVELFGEHMHRWFDLKRSPGFTNPSKSRADEVLKPLKGAFWQAEDVLFPIPAGQILLNPNLIQNKGYF